MYRAVVASLLMTISLAASGPVVDLLRQGRFGEAKRLLETSEAHPRYQLLYYAMVESDVARACSLYQVIAIRYANTDCDTVARERLQLARDMGFVIIPISEWDQAPADVQRPAFTAYARDSIAASTGRPPESVRAIRQPEVEEAPAAGDSLFEEFAPDIDELEANEEENEDPYEPVTLPDSLHRVSQPSPAVSATPAPHVKPLPPSTGPHDVSDNNEQKWYIQVGAFKNVDNADRLAARLRGEGYAVKLVPRETTDGTLMQVRVGGYSSKAECVPVADELREKFDVPAQIIVE